MPLLYDHEADQAFHIRLHPLIAGHLRVKGLSLEEAADLAEMAASDFVIACEVGSFSSGLDSTALQMLANIELSIRDIVQILNYKMPPLAVVFCATAESNLDTLSSAS